MLKKLSRYLGLILLTVLALESKAGVFKGRVVDESDNPLPGASIKIPDDTLNAVSDVNGDFTLDIAGRNVVRIKVLMVGYLPVEETIRADRGGKDNILRLTIDPTSLSEIVITATRTPKSLKDVPVVTRLINGDDIKKTDATNIQDLLIQEIPGLEFGYAMTQETALTMNGFGGNSILFLVDGERMAGETMDNVDYHRLTLENIGRVEIVKGASSALYGANAVGGVINLISRESKDPWNISLNGKYGSFTDDWRGGGVANFNSKHWNSSTTLQYHTSKTVQLTGPFDFESTIHQIYGGKSWNFKERLIYRVNDNLRFIARGNYFYRISNRSNYDDHFHDYSGGLKGEYTIDSSRNLEVSYSYDQYDKSRFINGVRTHDHDYSNRQHMAHGLFTKYWGLNGLTVGADYMHDYLESYQFDRGVAHQQTSVDVFAQFDYNPLSWLNIIASLRDDYYSASKNNAMTSRLAFMFKPAWLTIRTSYAGGFRAPTLKEMYMNFDMAGIQMIYGNPNLKPERSHNINVSLERAAHVRNGFCAGSYTLNVTGYYNHYENRITIADVPDFDPDNPATIYVNEKGIRVSGLDITGRYYTNFGMGLTVNYSYYHVGGHSLESAFSQPRPHSATWKLDYDKQLCSFWKIYTAISGRYLGKPKSVYETSKAYSIWKYTFQQTIWRGINVNFEIDNIFNYKPKVFYWNSPLTKGISFNIGISLNINDLF